MQRQLDAPQHIVLITIALGLGLVLLGQMLVNEPWFPIYRMTLATDYDVLWSASQNFLAGHNLYQDIRYVFPPIPAMLNSPLLYFPTDMAVLHWVLACGVFISIVLSMSLLYHTFFPGNWRSDVAFLVVASSIAALSYPVYFLVSRVNIDGGVLLLLCIGLYMLARHERIAGVFFALAIACKIYPILIVLPLVAQRRWQALAVLGLTMALLVLVAPGLWLEFLQERIWHRAALPGFDGTTGSLNGSLAATFWRLSHFLGGESHFWSQVGYLVWLTLLSTCWGLDWVSGKRSDSRDACAQAILYLPFMVAVPQVAYHYELVCVLPMLAMLSWRWQHSASPLETAWLTTIALGLAISQFQAYSAVSKISTGIPGLGLFIIMLGVTAYQVVRFKAAQRQRQPSVAVAP